jgi:hypothetical protein
MCKSTFSTFTRNYSYEKKDRVSSMTFRRKLDPYWCNLSVAVVDKYHSKEAEWIDLGSNNVASPRISLSTI